MRIILTVGICVLLLVGCKKSPPPPKSNPPVPTAAMRVTVWHVIQFNPRIDTLLADATVSLYKTEQDRLDQINRVNQATTDTTGEVFFNFLPDELYYLAIDHDSLGHEEDLVSTPAGTTSLVDILYY